MEVLITLVAVICGVLNLILFIKLWKACDDITELKKLATTGAIAKISTTGQDMVTQNQATSQMQAKAIASIANEDVLSEVVLEIAELEVRINDLSSAEKKYNVLNKFLSRKEDELNNSTTIFNMKETHATWIKILQRVAPLYSELGKSIPEEYNEDSV